MKAVGKTAARVFLALDNEIAAGRLTHVEAVAAVGNVLAGLIASIDDARSREIVTEVAHRAIDRAIGVVLEANADGLRMAAIIGHGA